MAADNSGSFVQRIGIEDFRVEIGLTGSGTAPLGRDDDPLGREVAS